MSNPNPDRHPIRRALVSVFDKTGLVELGAALTAADVQIFSTGSTASTLAAAGIPVTEVSDLTGFPECLDGRVKTLHPAVHAGILADQTRPEHLAQLADLGLEPFDLVAVNLYPFADTIAATDDFARCIEMIDIGGPTMVRASAKNHASVAILTNPNQYAALTEALALGGTTLDQRKELALEAFRHTASYDVTVASWLGAQIQPDGVPGWLGATYRLENALRYGENPHQGAGLFLSESPTRGARPQLAAAEQLGGKEMSYNNYQDTQAAVRAAFDQAQPTVAIIKHANPCGIATADTIDAAYQAAFDCDPLSAYGSVVAANRPVDLATAQRIVHVFTEVVAAPGFSPEALELLRTKKNLRLLVVQQGSGSWEFTPIDGGAIAQQIDRLDAAGSREDGTRFGDAPENWTLVAGPAASELVLRDLDFAWRAVRSVKSNAILLAKDGATVGVGMGQVNRVDSAKLAVERANTLADGERRTAGAVASSDAFFPFADGLQVLIDADVTAVVAPGGSVRDDEVIQAAKDAGLTLYFTGTRHFWH